MLYYNSPRVASRFPAWRSIASDPSGLELEFVLRSVLEREARVTMKAAAFVHMYSQSIPKEARIPAFVGTYM